MKHAFDFALTTYCQARCRSCARTNQHTGEKEDWLELKHMDYDVFKKVLESSKVFTPDRCDWIQFCGELGDPCMHPKIEEFVDLSLLHADCVHINTNGGLRQPAWYKKLASYGSKIKIKFGIDGVNHDTNWKYREGVDFDRAMKNMETYFHNDGVGSWHFLIFDWNWHQITEAQRIADNIGAEIQFKWNTRSFGKITDENRIKAQELLDTCNQ